MLRMDAVQFSPVAGHVDSHMKRETSTLSIEQRNTLDRPCISHATGRHFLISIQKRESCDRKEQASNVSHSAYEELYVSFPKNNILRAYFAIIKY